MKGSSSVIDLNEKADDDATPAGDARDQATVPPLPQSESPEGSVDLTPSQRAPVSEAEIASDAPAWSPEEPSRLPETAREGGGRAEPPGGDETKKLVIGRGIVLKGEINSCDLLVVEGEVEATMKACREIKIAPTGSFKGQVEFDRADISGVFKGELTAREHLVVRATGNVTGKVRFGELEVERGGQVIGDIQVFGEGAAAGKAAQNGVGESAK
jgi:cytoskeletal protein CcmA (bactofilin family)